MRKRPRSPSETPVSRRWIIPPPLLATGEVFPGHGILEEVPGDAGLLLWRCCSDVELWASVPPRDRRHLFSEEAWQKRMDAIALCSVPAMTAFQLRITAEVLTNGESVQPLKISAACQVLSAWASSQGYPRTAIALAQAGALAAPSDATSAFHVGLAARKIANYPKAESWFRRAIGVARRARDWKAYALAYNGLGSMYMQRGAVPLAKASLVSALKAARAHGVWSVRGPVLHDLFILAANAGDWPEADRLARRAFRAYGKRHPRLPALAYDVAYSWMLRGFFDQALPVFQAVVERTNDRSLRLLFLSSLARAASAAGKKMLFAEAWVEAWAIIHGNESTERVPEALINLARAARRRSTMVSGHILRHTMRCPSRSCAKRHMRASRLNRSSIR